MGQPFWELTQLVITTLYNNPEKVTSKCESEKKDCWIKFKCLKIAFLIKKIVLTFICLMSISSANINFGPSPLDFLMSTQHSVLKRLQFVISLTLFSVLPSKHVRVVSMSRHVTIDRSWMGRVTLKLTVNQGRPLLQNSKNNYLVFFYRLAC